MATRRKDYITYGIGPAELPQAVAAGKCWHQTTEHLRGAAMGYTVELIGLWDDGERRTERVQLWDGDDNETRNDSKAYTRTTVRPATMADI